MREKFSTFKEIKPKLYAAIRFKCVKVFISGQLWWSRPLMSALWSLRQEEDDKAHHKYRHTHTHTQKEKGGGRGRWRGRIMTWSLVLRLLI